MWAEAQFDGQQYSEDVQVRSKQCRDLQSKAAAAAVADDVAGPRSCSAGSVNGELQVSARQQVLLRAAGGRQIPSRCRQR